MKAVIIFATIALALAEPPVPSSQYLPSNQYATTNQDSFAPPSAQYGPPRPFAPRPSATYGTPSFGGQTTAIIRPNTQYGAPSRPSTQYGAPRPGGGFGGYGGGYDDQSEPANYNFEYHVQDAASNNDFGHQESRQGDVAQGKYFVLLPDGRRQVVEYVADNDGYKPKISYEQVGPAFGAGGYGGAAGGYPSGGPGGYPSGGAGGYPSGGAGGYHY